MGFVTYPRPSLDAPECVSGGGSRRFGEGRGSSYEMKLSYLFKTLFLMIRQMSLELQ